MAKLKSFEEYIIDMDSAEEIEKDMVAMGEPEAAGDGEEVQSPEQEIGAEEVEDGTEGEEAGEEVEDMEGPESEGEQDMKIDGEVVDTEPEDKSDEIEDQLEDPEEFEAEVEEGNAFGDAVRKAKEAGEDEFEFDGKTYKVEEELDATGESEEVNEGLHPKLKKAQKAIKKGETVYGENVRFPGRFKILELGDMYATVDYEDGTEPMEMASINIKIDSLQFESVVTEEVEEGDKEEVAKALVADMMKEMFEACKNEAKTYEEDMHDEHTIESYMNENAALAAALAAQALKEMKEDMTLEMYEAACEGLKESYSKKIDEMKEAWNAEGEEFEVED